MTNTIAQAAVGVDRIRAILEADTIIPQRPDARDPQTLKGEIEFQNVSFSYNDEAKVLTDVSFSIKAGQMVGVVGPTGCGKSTIVSWTLSLSWIISERRLSVKPRIAALAPQ